MLHQRGLLPTALGLIFLLLNARQAGPNIHQAAIRAER
jgi:hypothetical protein